MAVFVYENDLSKRKRPFTNPSVFRPSIDVLDVGLDCLTIVTALTALFDNHCVTEQRCFAKCEAVRSDSTHGQYESAS